MTGVLAAVLSVSLAANGLLIRRLLARFDTLDERFRKVELALARHGLLTAEETNP